MTPRMLSPTSVNTYRRCPRKYYLKYIKGLREKPSIHLVRGKAVHNAIARFNDLRNKSPPDYGHMRSSLLGLYDDSWNDQKKETEALNLSEEDLATYHREGNHMLINWLKHHLQGGGKTAETEVKLFSQTHQVMGIIDAIRTDQGKVILADYKTSIRDSLTQDIKVQMALYALLYLDNFGVLPDTIAIEFLAQDSRIQFSVTDEFIQYAAKVLSEVREKTLSRNEENYPCTCGGWCEKDFLP